MKDPGNYEAATRGRLFCWRRAAGSGCRIPVSAASAHAEGFTLIEMIMVIVILGVLAVFVAPRMMGTSDFYARGFHDETLGYLRYAQKTAIAQRRTVCVSFGSSSVTLAIASASSTPGCASAGTLVGPRGESPVTLSAKPGVSFSTTLAPANFNFDALGQPVNSAGAAMSTQTFQVSGVTPSISIESATGYIHE